MKKKLSVLLRVLFCIYGLYLLISVCAYIYVYWDGKNTVPGQKYYLYNIDMDEFRSKYKKLYSNDSVLQYYISPYHGDKKKVRFVHSVGETGMVCKFYSEKGQVLMSFWVNKKTPLEIFYYGIENETIDDYRRNINDGSELARDDKYLTLFENEVLKNIGSFKRDNWQGYTCWVANFFYQHFFYILVTGFFLYITIKKTNGKIGDG